MRPHTPELADALLGPHNLRLVADIYHGTERVMQDLQLSEWEVQYNLTAQIKSGGAATVVYSPPDGRPFAPVGTEGVLSPYRARLQLSMLITAGQFSERVAMGWGRITSVPEGEDYVVTRDGVDYVTSSRVRIEWDGLESDILNRGFRWPEPATVSCWGELRRITGFPVAENVPDQPVPAATVWEAKQGGRLEAVQALGSVLGGRIVVTPQGALTLAPRALGPIVATLQTGPRGTIQNVSAPISLEGVYTAVVGVYETEAREPIYSAEAVQIGPLAVGGLLPERTRYHASEMVRTQASGDKAAAAVLYESLGSLSYQVRVQCLRHPGIENNDHVEVISPTRTVRGRVVSIGFGDSAMMTLIVEVPMEVGRVSS